MKVIRCKIGSKRKIVDNLAVTIGKFDGIHIGHQALINECKKYNMKTAVFTFFPHPSYVLNSGMNNNFLTPLNRKIEIIRGLKPDYLFIIDFDQFQSTLSKDVFINWLLELNVKVIVCGKDWHFGYKKSGSIEDIKKYFTVDVVEQLQINGVKVSTTEVKKAILDGNVALAAKMLNRLYRIEGMVVEGNHLGREIGFRTANIDIFGNVAPKRGVYAVKVKIDGVMYLGMCNIGINPTFNKLEYDRLEVHIIDYNSDLYSKTISISFIDHIRDEIKFNSKEELITQLENDRAFIKNNFHLD